MTSFMGGKLFRKLTTYFSVPRFRLPLFAHSVIGQASDRLELELERRVTR
jgi:hypothetical protein